ncbi:ATP-dependent DNA helicase RRM3-like [Silene latifolia]|uniref:ATP-dependent DNA helicase RRM3-like n=1 Tax=Silene latifolia TaxID=37657 RepID=UPI003D785AD4
MTARAMERYLEAMGKNMVTFGLDHLDTCIDDELRRTRDIVDALDAPVPTECKLYKSQLNTAQREAFTTIMEHVQQAKPGAFFVDGPGGTGKTFLYNALYAETRLMGKIVLPTASLGIAPANIPSDRTTHSQFKIPLECEVSLACDIPKQSSLAASIVDTSLIIWDEASMSNRHNIESLDFLLRDLCDPPQLFGGKVVVFGGDFWQTLPILPRKSQREVVEAILLSSQIWPQLIKFRLTENICAQSDPEFAQFSLSLGNGQLQTKEHEYIELPAGLVKTLEASSANPISELASIAFPELDNSATLDSSIFTDRAVLTPLNDDVDAINSVLIDKFPGQAVTYTSHDTMLDDNCAFYSVHQQT